MQNVVETTKNLSTDFSCSRCNGSGSVVIGYTYVRKAPCFKCNGTGLLKTSIAQRQKNLEQRQARKQRDAERAAEEAGVNWEIFAASEPKVAAFIARRQNSSFFQSLYAHACRTADLSEKQIAAVNKIMAQDSESVKPEPVTLDMGSVFQKFEAAKASGLKRPIMRLDGFCLLPAGENSRNAGSIYVKTGAAFEDTYLGKIAADGAFTRSRDCSDEQLNQLKMIAENVLEAAISYGRNTGRCSCCNRTLTNKKSIDLGIGPVCLSKWGMA